MLDPVPCAECLPSGRSGPGRLLRVSPISIPSPLRNLILLVSPRLLLVDTYSLAFYTVHFILQFRLLKIILRTALRRRFILYSQTVKNFQQNKEVFGNQRLQDSSCGGAVAGTRAVNSGQQLREERQWAMADKVERCELEYGPKKLP